MGDTITGRRRRRGRRLRTEAVLVTTIGVLTIIGLLMGAIEFTQILTRI